MTTITRLDVRDIRFPTSRDLDGSDAMNAAPDYSATYVILDTDSDGGHQGHGLTFTIGRGNEVCRRCSLTGLAYCWPRSGNDYCRHGALLARPDRWR